MSGELEAAGAAATAGLAASVIEGREAAHEAHGPCANCGAETQGRYCHACGQATHVHRSLGHVFEEFIHGVVHFDTKAWRTLPMLFGRPGTLTRDYVYGKRARYISPLALYLFSVFFMYFIFAMFPGPENTHMAQRAQLNDAAIELREARDGAAAALEVARQSGNEADINIATLRVQAAEAALAQTESELAEIVDGAESGEGEENWQQNVRDIAQSDNFVIIKGMPELNERFRKKLENPELAIYKMQQTAYKFSFLLAPISLLFISLLFLWKKGVTLYDHTVFALYSLSFAALIFVLMHLSGQSGWTNWIGGFAFALGLPIHTFFHLKGAYALSWFSAVWRTLVMLLFACMSLLVFLVIIVVIGLL